MYIVSFFRGYFCLSKGPYLLGAWRKQEYEQSREMIELWETFDRRERLCHSVAMKRKLDTWLSRQPF